MWGVGGQEWGSGWAKGAAGVVSAAAPEARCRGVGGTVVVCWPGERASGCGGRQPQGGREQHTGGERHHQPTAVLDLEAILR
jgi:hypothetical protein